VQFSAVSYLAVAEGLTRHARVLTAEIARTPLRRAQIKRMAQTLVEWHSEKSHFAANLFVEMRARRDSNSRPPGSKLEGTEKLEILRIGSH
jgi:hypothetical protein